MRQQHRLANFSGLNRIKYTINSTSHDVQDGRNIVGNDLIYLEQTVVKGITDFADRILVRCRVLAHQL